MSEPSQAPAARPPDPEPPRAPRARRDARLDRLALAVGWLAAVALLLTAWLAVQDPAVEGQAVLARRTGEFADAVILEWGRWLQSTSPGWEPLVSREVGSVPSGRPEPVEWWRDGPPRGPAFQALLAEAARREREGQLDEAVALMRDALALDVAPPSRAEGRLRLIQLAGRAGLAAEVSAQLTRALYELDGHELRDGTSYRLLCLLAAIPALPVEQRDVRAAQLIDDWREERFAWSAADAELSFAEDGRPVLVHHPWRAALRARLCAVVDALDDEARARMDGLLGRQPGDPARLPALDERIWERRLVELWRRAESTVAAGVADRAPPAERLLKASDESWAVRPHLELPAPAPARLHVVVRGLRPLRQRVELVSGEALQRAFAEHLRRAGLLRDGFAVDVHGEARELGHRLRYGVLPIGGRLTGAVRHPDPDSLVDDVRGRVLALRIGLLLAAALCATAGTALARALRRQQRLARLRSAFVASVSHELRTPVASLLLMAENLADGRVAPDRAPRYHALIRREATRLQRLVHDVLDVSRLERGLPPRLRLEAFDLPAFVDGLQGEVRGLVEAAGGRCEVHVGELPARARWDAESLRRAVLNLVDNALRHGRGADGLVLLSLDVRCEGARDADADPGAGATAEATADVTADPRVTITVADQGRGLGPRPSALFEPFARGGREDEAPGTGLGLAIVRAIAEGHGGGLRAVPGARGACLELSLPVTPRGVPAEPQPESPS